MNTLIFATNNQHKIEEIRSIIGNKFNIITLAEAGINVDIPEPHETLEENSYEKASYIYKITNESCFAEDTGLEVEALNGEPGVLSARYGGDEKNSLENIKKVLYNLDDIGNRAAQFRTVISLIIKGELHQFEGVSIGTITEEIKGNDGFGYDPIFVPRGSDKTFAEMTLEEKNAFSHRRKATDKLIEFLSQFD